MAGCYGETPLPPRGVGGKKACKHRNSKHAFPVMDSWALRMILHAYVCMQQSGKNWSVYYMYRQFKAEPRLISISSSRTVSLMQKRHFANHQSVSSSQRVALPFSRLSSRPSQSMAIMKFRSSLRCFLFHTSYWLDEHVQSPTHSEKVASWAIRYQGQGA